MNLGGAFENFTKVGHSPTHAQRSKKRNFANVENNRDRDEMNVEDMDTYPFNTAGASRGKRSNMRNMLGYNNSDGEEDGDDPQSAMLNEYYATLTA